MAMVVAEFGEPVRGPSGSGFRARACALATPRGQWQGWIEFDPIDGAPTFRSPHETIVATRSAVVLWASELTASHLERALTRALGRLQTSR